MRSSRLSPIITASSGSAPVSSRHLLMSSALVTGTLVLALLTWSKNGRMPSFSRASSENSSAMRVATHISYPSERSSSSASAVPGNPFTMPKPSLAKTDT